MPSDLAFNGCAVPLHLQATAWLAHLALAWTTHRIVVTGQPATARTVGLVLAGITLFGVSMAVAVEAKVLSNLPTGH